MKTGLSQVNHLESSNMSNKALIKAATDITLYKEDSRIKAKIKTTGKPIQYELTSMVPFGVGKHPQAKASAKSDLVLNLNPNDYKLLSELHSVLQAQKLNNKVKLHPWFKEYKDYYQFKVKIDASCEVIKNGKEVGMDSIVNGSKIKVLIRLGDQWSMNKMTGFSWTAVQVTFINDNADDDVDDEPLTQIIESDDDDADDDDEDDDDDDDDEEEEEDPEPPKKTRRSK